MKKVEPADPDTDELICRTIDNDQLAREQLLDRHRDRLTRMIAVRMDPRLKRRLDPADLVQDVLLKALDRLPAYLRDRPIAFYPWLRQIAEQQLVDAFRQHVQAQKRAVDQEADYQSMISPVSDHSTIMLADLLVARQSTPSQHVHVLQIKQQVQNALALLQESYREVLVMRYLEELSIREIAECLDVSEAAIKMRHMRAMTQLGAVLGHSGSSTD